MRPTIIILFFVIAFSMITYKALNYEPILIQTTLLNEMINKIDHLFILHAHFISLLQQTHDNFHNDCLILRTYARIYKQNCLKFIYSYNLD